jgi:DNA-binding XRE family transcriptional regulator
MMEPNDRLQKARQEAGYENAVDAARAFGWGQSTYISHENGTRGLKPTIAERYAKAFRVTPEWILYGNKGKKAAAAPEKRTVDAGRLCRRRRYGALLRRSGAVRRCARPEGSSDETVAVEIRGDSLGALFDRWLVFYDDVHRPVTADQVGKLCVVGLLDGRILIKKVQRSRARQGLFHLFSNTEAPILDVEIEWAAKVLNMVPQ